MLTNKQRNEVAESEDHIKKEKTQATASLKMEINQERLTPASYRCHGKQIYGMEWMNEQNQSRQNT